MPKQKPSDGSVIEVLLKSDCTAATTRRVVPTTSLQSASASATFLHSSEFFSKSDASTGFLGQAGDCPGKQSERKPSSAYFSLTPAAVIPVCAGLYSQMPLNRIAKPHPRYHRTK